MKSLIWRLYLLVAFTGLAWFGPVIPAFAAEEHAGPADRLERLERRVNEMAERQQQMMGNMKGQMKPQEDHTPMARQGNQIFRPPMPNPVGPPQIAPQPTQARHLKGLHDFLRLLFLIAIICNILLAIWIFTDIRKRSEGSGIFIALALVAGIPAALIYALTRIGDKKT